jgi:hypothetical protein
MKNLIYGAAMLFTITSCTTAPITSDSLIGGRYEIDLVSFEGSALGVWEDTTYASYGVIEFKENEVVMQDTLSRLGAMFTLETTFDVEYAGDAVIISLEDEDGLTQWMTWEFNSNGAFTLYNLEDWSQLNPLYSVTLEKTLILTEL